MSTTNRKALAARIARAADAVLREQNYVCAIDVMLEIGWLAPRHVTQWRTQQLPFLEQGIQANPKKVSAAMRMFSSWADAAGLKPSTADYVARTKRRERLRFSESGELAIEKVWRTHWVSCELPEAKRRRIEENAQKPPELLAFEPRDPDWRCHKCSGTSEFLMMEPPGPACLTCAGLERLEYLPAGNALLTRRARAKSKLTALVMRWNRSQKRYNRIGALVEPKALAEAQESLARGE